MLTFDPSSRFTFFLLPGLIQRPDHQPPTPAPGLTRSLLQPRHREPPNLGHRRRVIPRRPVQQPLRPVRGPVPNMLGNAPPVALRQLAQHRPHILPGLHKRLNPPKTAAHPLQQLSLLPLSQPDTYPDSRSRLRSCSPHKPHDRQAAAPRPTQPLTHTSPQVTTRSTAAVPGSDWKAPHHAARSLPRTHHQQFMIDCAAPANL